MGVKKLFRSQAPIIQGGKKEDTGLKRKDLILGGGSDLNTIEA